MGQFGSGKMGLRTMTVNPATGDVSMNFGPQPTEELRQQNLTVLQQKMTQALTSGAKTPLQVMLEESSRGNVVISAPEQDQLLDNMSAIVFSQVRNTTGNIAQALNVSLEQTGRIPKGMEPFLPEQIVQKARERAATIAVEQQSQLGGLADRVRAIEAEQEGRIAQIRAVIDVRKGQPPSDKATEALRQHESSLLKMQALYDRFSGSFVGPVRGAIPTGALAVPLVKILFPALGLQEGEAKFRALVSDIRSATIKQITGAQMNEFEAARILEAVPAITDTPEVFLAKQEVMLHNLAELQRITIALEAAGGRRFSGDVPQETVLIQGVPVAVFKAPTAAEVQASLRFNFNQLLESKAGISGPASSPRVPKARGTEAVTTILQQLGTP
jgi:hypothetical protein